MDGALHDDDVQVHGGTLLVHGDDALARDDVLVHDDVLPELVHDDAVERDVQDQHDAEVQLHDVEHAE